MKSIITLIVFALFFNHDGLAQSLSLDDLILIRGSDIDDINGVLIPKGWLFTGNLKNRKEPLRECVVDELVWAYGAEKYDNQAAHSFIIVERSYDCSNAVSYQTIDQKAYFKIRDAIKKYNMKSGNSVLDSDKEGNTYTTTTFVGNKYEVEMSVYVINRETKNSYTVRVFLK